MKVCHFRLDAEAERILQAAAVRFKTNRSAVLRLLLAVIAKPETDSARRAMLSILASLDAPPGPEAAP